MCDLSAKLVAWLDQELPGSEANDVARHIESCAECKRKLDSYRRVSSLFKAYCESTEEAATGRKLPPWIRTLSYTAAAVAVVVAALVLVLLRLPVEPLPPQAMAPTAPSIAPASDSNRAVAAAASAPVRPSLPTKVRHLRATAPMRYPDADFLPAEPGIQVAIPAEAMFPPGAMPAGVTFTADFSVASDGSVQRLRLQPRLVELQRRSTQP
ncbi:MAG TPA: zf-HC2 domain-containing protein [Acidobacteriaceae bacterium]|jgi:anti-sigma factor RsiW